MPALLIDSLTWVGVPLVMLLTLALLSASGGGDRNRDRFDI